MTKGEQIEKLSAEIVIIQLESLCKNRRMPTSVEIAEALLENESVVVLPCKVGDKYYRVNPSNFDGTLYVAEYDVDQIVVDHDGVCVVDSYYKIPWGVDEVYFLEEEAEQELKRRVENDKS